MYDQEMNYLYAWYESVLHCFRPTIYSRMIFLCLVLTLYKNRIYCKFEVLIFCLCFGWVRILLTNVLYLVPLFLLVIFLNINDTTCCWLRLSVSHGGAQVINIWMVECISCDFALTALGENGLSHNLSYYRSWQICCNGNATY